MSVANSTELLEIAQSVMLYFCKPCQSIPGVGEVRRTRNRVPVTSVPVQEASVSL